MRRRGFTLIELIITTLILAVIVVSIYSAFSIGIKAWKRGNESQDIQKVRIALLKIQKELKDSFFFSGAPFTGTSSEIVFPLSISEGNTQKIYIITYCISEDKNTNLKTLVRKETAFTERLEDRKEWIERPVFSARSIEFKYAYRLKDGSAGFEWQGFWDESQNGLPSAVRISFRLKDSDEIYNKTIFIPQGALGEQ